jgi:hypothetical protein
LEAEDNLVKNLIIFLVKILVTAEIRTLAGNPIGLAVQRLNHSATVTLSRGPQKYPFMGMNNHNFVELTRYSIQQFFLFLWLLIQCPFCELSEPTAVHLKR